MSSRPSIIRIKLKKGGWEVEIECEENKVKDAMENVISSLGSIPEISSPRKESSRGVLTCRGLIEQLWTEGWFSNPRNLGDVHDELARRGYHYDRTAVSHSLADLVREGSLTRQGGQRSYRYIQKKPPLIS
jgi:hypothetical protein